MDFHTGVSKESIKPSHSCHCCNKEPPKGEILCLVKCNLCQGPVDMCQSCYNRGYKLQCRNCRIKIGVGLYPLNYGSHKKSYFQLNY